MRRHVIFLFILKFDEYYYCILIKFYYFSLNCDILLYFYKLYSFDQNYNNIVNYNANKVKKIHNEIFFFFKFTIEVFSI